MHVSLVEVSESTVILLKLTFTALSRAACKSDALIGASVVRTAIMVAMFGMIIPAPFDMPPTVNVQPGYPISSPENDTAHSFGRVSVVMIARAARPRRGARGRGRQRQRDPDPKRIKGTSERR